LLSAGILIRSALGESARSPRGRGRKALGPAFSASRQVPVTQHWIQWPLQDPQWIATVRGRLQSLSWFMKCLKEPLSRLANRQDKTRGTVPFGSSGIADKTCGCF
jgi:hypothetical protein